MIFSLAAGLAMATALSILPAHAIVLTNRDATDRTLIVIEGDKQNELAVKAGEKIELCLQGCVIRLGDADDYEFDGTETVSLEDGLLFLDSPDDQAKLPH